MLSLYHMPASVCAAKVRIVLAEKNLPWESKLLERGAHTQPEYLKLNPNAVVPTLVHDDKIVIESTVINEYIDDVFPDLPLRPAASFGRAQSQLWTRREDSIHDAINTLTTAVLFRIGELQKTPEERAARLAQMPDPLRRRKWTEIVEHGLESPEIYTALVRLARLFRDMDKVLQTSPWLVGDLFGLADIGLIPYVHRIDLMQLDSFWKTPFPKLTDWYAAVRQRPSFAEGIGKWAVGQVAETLPIVGKEAAPTLERHYQAILAEI